MVRGLCKGSPDSYFLNKETLFGAVTLEIDSRPFAFCNLHTVAFIHL